MADHVRHQIRDAVVTAVTGLTTTGSRVYRSRVYPMETANLPGLLVYLGAEDITPSTIHAPSILERKLNLRIVAVAKAIVDLDETLDKICKEVEIAVAGMTFSAKGTIIGLTGIDEPELVGTSDKPTGQVTINLQADYYTANNAPDVAL